MYEKRTERIIGRKQFYIRLFKHFLGIVGLLILSLIVGILGFMVFEKLSLTESFLHASIMLSGLGLLEKPSTPQGHVFTGIYGLYAGLVFIASLSILVTPIIHRIIHKFHWDDEE
ncbi:MAG TPA: hypothetical protein VK076_08995 [Candidatus Sphingobacterium stercoripullorum]|mgnify:CR=1 FL=1|nr:hypothetical protein [Candidatus Sphingobacterium stercoripullorum]